MTETERYSVAEVTLELMAAVLRSDVGLGQNEAGSAQTARMTRILSYLEENYAVITSYSIHYTKLYE